jgi:adenine-specific DNA-methyltransferase
VNGNAGFDIVIGNPPYVKEYTYKTAFDGLRNSRYYQGKMDLWYLFACKSLDITKKETGLLCFIATNNWTTNAGASKMRNKIVADVTIHMLLDFGSYMIFESADIQTMVMIFKNSNRNDNYNFELRRLVGKNISYDDVMDLISKKETEKTEFLYPRISRKNLKDKTLTFSKDVYEDILDRIKVKGNITLNENEVANGIHPHYDYVSKATQKILGDSFRVGQGIFVLSNEEKESLHLTKKELELIKPYYTTKQLHKWFGNPNNDEWIIYTDSKFKYTENIKPYPNIKRHLDKFQKVITSDNKPYGLHRARDEYFFKGEKIVALRKCVNEPIFTYTDFDCYVSATFYVIKTERINQKYLTAVLNSKLIAFWLRKKGKMQGNNYQLDKGPLLNIPIFNSPTNEQKPIIKLVDQILTVKAANPQADSSAIEKQIDEMVYKLYELTEEEVRIVEGNLK